MNALIRWYALQSGDGIAVNTDSLVPENVIAILRSGTRDDNMLVDSSMVDSMLMASYGLLVCTQGASNGCDNDADTS